jgi:hypothetical protein
MVVTNKRGLDWMIRFINHTFTITRNGNNLQFTINLQPNPSSLTAEDSLQSQVKVKVTFWLTVSQSVSLMTRYLLLFDSYGLVFMGRPLWRDDRSVFCICCWALPAQSFSGPSPLWLATIYCCLRFQTSLFVASYDSLHSILILFLYSPESGP